MEEDESSEHAVSLEQLKKGRSYRKMLFLKSGFMELEEDMASIPGEQRFKIFIKMHTNNMGIY